MCTKTNSPTVSIAEHECLLKPLLRCKFSLSSTKVPPRIESDINDIFCQHFPPFPAISRCFPPFPAISRHFPQFPAVSRRFPPFPAISRNILQFPADSRHFLQNFQIFNFPTFPAVSRTIPPFPALSRHFPHYPATSRTIPPLPAISRHKCAAGNVGIWRKKSATILGGTLFGWNTTRNSGKLACENWNHF